MARVDFYILEQAKDNERLTFTCRLADKAVKQGLNVHVHSESSAQAQQLDKLMWTFRQDSFVPHVLAENKTDQPNPVVIGHQQPDKYEADVLINLTAEVPAWYIGFERVAEIVDSSEQARESGRARFRWYREQGCEPQTHKIG